MSRVLHLKKVTQCAVLDEFGLFLVLADKVLPSLSIPMIFNLLYFPGTLRLPS